MKEELRCLDKEWILVRCQEKAPFIAEEVVGWASLWDKVLEYKLEHARGVQALARVLGHHGKGEKLCPLCSEQSLDVSVVRHALSVHYKDLGLSVGDESHLLSLLGERRESQVEQATYIQTSEQTDFPIILSFIFYLFVEYVGSPVCPHVVCECSVVGERDLI